jgi:hypothetical protein
MALEPTSGISKTDFKEFREDAFAKEFLGIAEAVRKLDATPVLQ